MSLERKNKNFKVTAAPTKTDSDLGGVVLSVTKNGNQWTSIYLLEDEIPAVLEALYAAFKSVSG